jgi:hypothetical protein
MTTAASIVAAEVGRELLIVSRDPSPIPEIAAVGISSME